MSTRPHVREWRERVVAQSSALVRSLGLAHHWQTLLDDGRFASMTEIAAIEGMDPARASRIARLAHLAPYIVEACLAGNSSEIALEHPVRGGSLPLDWPTQREKLAARR